MLINLSGLLFCLPCLLTLVGVDVWSGMKVELVLVSKPTEEVVLGFA